MTLHQLRFAALGHDKMLILIRFPHMHAGLLEYRALRSIR